MKRRTPIRRENPERAAVLRAEAFGAQAELCRRSPCAIPSCGRSPPSDPAHHPSRGAGGLDRDTFPLCRAHHEEQHRVGVVTFARRHRVVLEELVAAMRARVAGGPLSPPGYDVPQGDLPF